MTSKATTIRLAITELGLPPIVLQIFDTKRMSGPYQSKFGYPRVLLLSDEEEWGAWGCPSMVPLWDDGNAGVIVAHCPAGGMQGFFRFELEGKVMPPVGMGWQQVLVGEFKRLWLQETPAEEIQEIARAFEFKHLAQLTKELNQINTYRASALDPWYQDFVRRVGPV